MTTLPAQSIPPSFTATPHPLAYWRFDADNERCLTARSATPYRLRVIGERPRLISSGPFGAAWRFDGEQQLVLPRAQLGALNRAGDDSPVTVVAWLRRRGDHPWQFVAGVWDETRHQRQYGLFINAAGYTRIGADERTPCQGRVHGHVSAHGGPTPGRRVCLSYATGATELGFDRWHTIAMSFDGRHSRVFVDGQLDALPDANPFPHPHPLHNGGRDGADFTVGANSVAGETRNYLHADLAALAIFPQALDPATIPDPAGYVV